MIRITGKYKDDLSEKVLHDFYEKAEWISYTKDMDKMGRAFKNSLYVVTAWDGESLIGLLRVVGDGETIIFIQDIIVLEGYRRHKIGSSMINKVLKRYPAVRQKVLVTEEDEDVRGFFEEVGFMSCDQGNLVAFSRFD